jgi:LPS sulfotransferase NodH
MERMRGPKLPLTVYLNYFDLMKVKDYADTIRVSDSAWVAGLIDRALHGIDTAGKPLPATATAFLIAVAEEWLVQLPKETRDVARKRVMQRSKELSDNQRQGMV